MLTKTKYLKFLEAPMHLWTAEHGQAEESPSDFVQLLMAQDMEVQDLARQYLDQRIAEEAPGATVYFEKELVDEPYYARLDAAVYYPDEDVWDIFEFKSGNSISKEYKLDAAFQRLVALANLNVRHTYILHLNKHYQRDGEIDLSQFFVLENVNQEIRDLCEELGLGRESAWQVVQAASPNGIPTCTKPKDCPCPELCHPDLPEHSIYDLPRIWRKVPELRAAGITAIRDIPDGFGLNEIQAKHAEVVKRGAPMIDTSGVKAALDEMVFPLYFLDYETFNPAVPWFDGYSPYQHIVFQYSLHVFESPEAEAAHYEYLATEKEDPTPGLAADLLGRIAPTGSVVVWYQPFESGRNREMAAMHPRFAAGLNSINERIFDLMLIFSRGSYVHPDFHGSASIKNVLPVMAPDLSYEGMPVPNGTSAMLSWDRMMSGEMDAAEFEQTRQDLLDYCKLDTWAMVRIWQALLAVIR